MIVQRVTFKVKLGCMDKLVELFKAQVATWDKPINWRAYTIRFGESDRVAIEFEYENLAEFDKVETAMWAKPEAAKFYKKTLELIETGGTIEIWNLVEA
jgi:hypothetical protein